MVVNIDDTQRVVVSGPGRRSGALTILLCEVTNAADARRTLRTLVADGPSPRISLFGAGNLEPGDRWDGYRLAIAFTYAGLVALERPRRELATFPLEFRQGPVARAAIVNDVSTNDPSLWLEPFHQQRDRVHVVVFVWESDFTEPGQADRAGPHAQAVAQQLTRSGQGLSSVAQLRGRQRRANAPNGDTAFIEPFGFADPVAQPIIIGFEGDRNDPNRRAHVGEFVLGERGDADPAVRRHYVPGDHTDETERVGYHGTFGALRIMAQHVARATSMPADTMAEIVGRAPFGPLEDSQSLKGDHSDDPDGKHCPIGSHIRRANPLAGTVVNRSSSRRWLLRRGIPYGIDDRCDEQAEHRELPLVPGLRGTAEQGLIGLFLCASLGDQYEGVLGEWLNRGLHDPRLTGTNDRLVGLQPDGTRLVTTRGVAYLFFPAKHGIEILASPPTTTDTQP